MDARGALDRLQAAKADGSLNELCERFGLDLVVVFGSVIRDDAEPRDLDIAVHYRGERPSPVAMVEAFVQLTRFDQIDLMDLNRADPFAREQALVGTLPLVERDSELLPTMQMTAMNQRMDTEWLHRMSLEAMAG
ncbi:nucleotidyltransferase family protein [Glycomyces buryatensis]|uniref:Nucleotidyltransferase domain-containing protein n=1 Tax=Glycomyces buryatensis TaxID=2570927 RepID=A0A4S8QDD6_9ACTN|nr:nucleotidyltransferase domain-containing protein [Glycomyces buryatensis]THV41092.1 nucleotidyltransferase domain-containing protein [Glycomyces buryatensis]